MTKTSLFCFSEMFKMSVNILSFFNVINLSGLFPEILVIHCLVVLGVSLTPLCAGYEEIVAYVNRSTKASKAELALH